MEEQLALAGVTATIGREHFYPSVRAAVDGSSRVGDAEAAAIGERG